MKMIEHGHWARFISTGVGLWLMVAPAVLGYADGPAETLHRIVGPFIASFAIIAIWETTRELRHLNTAGAVVLMAGPLLLGFGGAAAVNSVVSGVIVLLTSRVKGKVEGEYAGGWRTVWRGRSG